MKKLPEELETMDERDLAQQRALRDEQLAPLFRRWPRLSRPEMRRLKAMYTERLRIARHLGRLRGRR